MKRDACRDQKQIHCPQVCEERVSLQLILGRWHAITVALSANSGLMEMGLVSHILPWQMLDTGVVKMSRLPFV